MGKEYRTQHRLQNEANEWNAAENEKARQFSSDEAQKQRDFERDEWLNRFDRESSEYYRQQSFSNKEAYEYWLKQQEYNSPANMATRLHEAGLNASAALNAQQFGGTGLQAAPTSVPQPSSPAGASASAPAPLGATAPHVDFSNPGAIADIGKFLKDVSDAASSNVQLQPLVKKISAEADNFIAQAGLSEAMTEGYRIENLIKENTKDARINQEWEKYRNLCADTILKGVTTEKFRAEEIYTNSLNILAELEKHLKGKALEEATFRVMHQADLYYNQVMEIRSRIFKNYKEGNLADSQAQLNALEYKFNDETFVNRKTSERFKNFIQAREITGLDLKNALLRGDIKLQEMGLTHAELQLLREKDLIDARGDLLFQGIDSAIYWLSQFVGIGMNGSVSATSVSK